MFASTNWILLDSCPLLLVHGPPVLLALVILSVQNSMISVMRSSRWYKLYTVLAMTYCFEVLLWIIYIYVHVYEYDLKHCSFGQLPYLGLVCFPPLFLRGTIKIPLFFFVFSHLILFDSISTIPHRSSQYTHHKLFLSSWIHWGRVTAPLATLNLQVHRGLQVPLCRIKNDSAFHWKQRRFWG